MIATQKKRRISTWVRRPTVVVMPDRTEELSERDAAFTLDSVTFVVDWAIGEEQLDSTWLD